MIARAWLLALMLPAAGDAQTPRTGDKRLVIAVLDSQTVQKTDDDALNRGLTLGLEEASHTARMFGWELVVLRAPAGLSAGAAVRHFLRPGVTAIVGDLASSVSIVSGSRRQPLLINTEKIGRVSASRCGDRLLNVLPQSALVAWHHSLDRFGAGQLNERYRKRFGTEMDERAWAGWMGVKILVDAALRKGTSDPQPLEDYLLGDDARFDGHKGVPLSFDRRTRELVQPLYRTAANGEAATVHPAELAASAPPQIADDRSCRSEAR